MRNFQAIEQIRLKYQFLLPYLNEKTRRIWAAVESLTVGRGGVSQVSSATGLSRTTIYTGIRELQSHSKTLEVEQHQSIRQSGGGVKNSHRAIRH
jgi:DNA-binding phage protein